MSDIPEAVGSMAEGAAAARAVEPGHGELKDGHFAESECLNCGAALTGAYCSTCGQAAHLHRTLGGFLHDLAHGVLHLEGKTWRTLPLLAWRPGELTRRYIEGQRARFVSPMALFLFSVFMIFAVFQLMGISPPTDLDPDYTVDEQAEALVSQLGERREELERQLAGTPAEDQAKAEIETQIAQLTRDIENASTFRTQLAEGVGRSIDSVDTGSSRLDEAVAKWRKNPGLALYKMQANSYKFSWLLIPLSMPFVWLLFAWKRRFGLYDHAVFITYSIAFMTLFFIVLAILGGLGVSLAWLFTAGTTIPLWHLFRQLRGAYGLSRFSATWRTVAMVFFIAVVSLLFAAALMMLGALG